VSIETPNPLPARAELNSGCEDTVKALLKCLKCFHPVLLVSAGLFVLANHFLTGQGGPCPSPLIILFAPIELGIAVGLALSLFRVFLWVIERPRKEDESP